MTDKYFTVTVKLSETELADYLINQGYGEDELEDLNLSDEAVEAVSCILGNEFSDCSCYNDSSVIYGDL